MNATTSTSESRCLTLLRDFGYSWSGTTLTEKGIRGFTSSRIIGRFTSVYAAVEHLIPIVHNDEFSIRYIEICNP